VGSASPAACQCAADAFLDPTAAANRAIALLPGTAQFSTRAGRGGRAYAATAVFDSAAAAGPPTARGGVAFDRTLAQYLDGRAHTFSILTHGGFTAVAVVRFAGTAASDERIFDFGSAATNTNNIILQREAGTSALKFSILTPSQATCTVTSTAVLTQNTWLTVVAIYTHSSRIMQLRIGAETAIAAACGAAAADRAVDTTSVGKDTAAAQYLGGSLAGLYAVDAVLPEAEIAVLIARMHRGEDPLQACAACPVHAVSGQGSVGEDACQCTTGSLSTAISARVPREVRARAVVVQPARAQLAALAGRNTTLVDLKTGGTGWRLVRYLPPTSAGWYSGNDNLAGVLPRGTAYNDFSEWSALFGVFDEFCFSTANFAHWLQCKRNQAVGSFYDHSVGRDVLRSSISPAASYTAKWVYQSGSGSPADPLIGLRDRGQTPYNTETGDRTLYTENAFSQTGHYSLVSIPLDGGMNVWVRMNRNKPAVSPTGGPGGGGMLTFDRMQGAFLDGGAHTFNIASNWGFTLVAVVKFTGGVSGWERIIDFGNGFAHDNIHLMRSWTTSELMFSISNGNEMCERSTTHGPIIQDTWITIVARYTATDKTMHLRVGDVESSHQCTADRTDRTLAITYIAKATDGVATFNGHIAGVYAVDALLTPAQIAALTASMHAGADPQRDVCRACPVGVVCAAPCAAGTRLIPGSATCCPLHSNLAAAGGAEEGCACNPGFAGRNGQVCVACPAGAHKTGAGNAPCAVCPADTYSNAPASLACTPCPRGANSSAGSTSAAMCIASPRVEPGTPAAAEDAAPASDNGVPPAMIGAIAGAVVVVGGVAFFASGGAALFAGGSSATSMGSVATATAGASAHIHADHGYSRNVQHVYTGLPPGGRHEWGGSYDYHAHAPHPVLAWAAP